MNCQQISKYIYDYCDGTVSPEQRDQIEQHLAHCQSCQISYKLTLIENSVLKSPVLPEMSPGFTGQVMQALDSVDGSLLKANSVQKMKWQGPAMMSVALVAVLLLALYLPGHWSNKTNLAQQHLPRPVTIAAGARNLEKGGALPIEQQSIPETNNNKKVKPAKGEASDTGLQAKPSSSKESLPVRTANQQTQTKSYNHTMVAALDQDRSVSSSGASRAIPSLSQAKSTTSSTVHYIPSQIPANYQLIEQSNQANNTSYYYQDPSHNAYLTITISYPDASQDMRSSLGLLGNAAPGYSDGAAVPSPSPAPAGSSVKSFSLPAANSLTLQLDDAGAPCEATLLSNLPPAELTALAQEIKFQPSK